MLKDNIGKTKTMTVANNKSITIWGLLPEEVLNRWITTEEHVSYVTFVNQQSLVKNVKESIVIIVVTNVGKK